MSDNRIKDNMSNNKEGMRIVHDYDELEEGYNYTMVLKDVPLIDPITNTLIEGKDELESMEIVQGNKKRDISKDPYLKAVEEELKDTINKPNVIFIFHLKAGIELDETGQYDPNKVTSLAAIKEKLKKKAANMMTLETPKVFGSAYEEPVKIKKKVGMQKRRRVEIDIGEYLDKEGGEDHLSKKEDVRREQEIKKSETELNDQLKKTYNYGRAISKAKKLTEDFFQANEEHDEIQEALDRQRRAIMNKEKRGEELTREIITQTSSKEEEVKEVKDDVVITDLNFIKGLPSTKDRREYQEKIVKRTQFSLKDAKSGMTSVVNVPLPTEVLGHFAPGYSSCVPSSYQPTPKLEPQKSLGPEEKEEEKNVAKTEVKPIAPLEENALDELLIGKGVGNAIKVLRGRKLLGHTMYIGRSKDSTGEQELDKFEKAGIKGGEKLDLDYRDESGYKMSIKEAWRNLGRKFHGIKQSKKKLEKTLQKREQEKKKLLSDQVKDSKLSQALSKVQHERNVPFMVLDAKTKGPLIF
jgi:hypothetical protein